MFENFVKFKSSIDQDFFFWFCALSGSGMFVVQFLLTLLGSGENSDWDDSSNIDSLKVRWLSKQTIAGFLMMFGWSALTCKHEFALRGIASMAIAFVAGMITVLISGFIFKAAKKLRSSGTVFKLEDAVGKEALVYQRIPKDGVGKITISLHGLTHELDAISLGQEDLSSFIPVRIIKKADETTVVVVPIIHKQLQELGICQGGALNLSQAEPSPKQSQLE
jgi:hypothetical protein